MCRRRTDSFESFFPHLGHGMPLPICLQIIQLTQFILIKMSLFWIYLIRTEGDGVVMFSNLRTVYHIHDRRLASVHRSWNHLFFDFQFSSNFFRLPLSAARLMRVCRMAFFLLFSMVLHHLLRARRYFLSLLHHLLTSIVHDLWIESIQWRYLNQFPEIKWHFINYYYIMSQKFSPLRFQFLLQFHIYHHSHHSLFATIHSPGYLTVPFLNLNYVL